MADVELRQLRYLIAVADEGGISHAAASLGMTQPALTRAIATLERSVGVALLDRLPRGSVLTAAGRILADRARAINQEVAAAVRQSRETSAQIPPLRVSARACDYDTLGDLIAAGPGEKIEPVMAHWRTQLASLRSGAADVALVSGEFDETGLDTTLVATQERVAMVPENQRFAWRDVVDRTDLLPYHVLGWAGSTPQERDYWLDGAPLAGAEVEDLLQLFVHVRNDDGIAFVPLPMVEEAPSMRGVRLIRVNDLAPARVRLAWLSEQTSTRIARFVAAGVGAV
ncbi:LysR family transcriptional regulator [Actinoplanes sp. NBRC 103695]|uniref:LysR family transcriptional regulator n=1 Tax=Actinoplanes sp. NBRC 103695 TaxID=3032202 RepID=UPI0025568D0B|nr:LysR family transcriptional regulator [Actinoplanes sp. NBRC 103695]